VLRVDLGSEFVLGRDFFGLVDDQHVELLASNLKPGCCCTAAARPGPGSLALSPGSAAAEQGPGCPGRERRKLRTGLTEKYDFSSSIST
jgi:hypothetical protein